MVGFLFCSFLFSVLAIFEWLSMQEILFALKFSDSCCPYPQFGKHISDCLSLIVLKFDVEKAELKTLISLSVIEAIVWLMRRARYSIVCALSSMFSLS